MLYQSAGDTQHNHGKHGHLPSADTVSQTAKEMSGYQITKTIGNKYGSKLPTLYSTKRLF